MTEKANESTLEDFYNVDKKQHDGICAHLIIAHVNKDTLKISVKSKYCF